jgi:hypothetical protein
VLLSGSVNKSEHEHDHGALPSWDVKHQSLQLFSCFQSLQAMMLEFNTTTTIIASRTWGWDRLASDAYE